MQLRGVAFSFVRCKKSRDYFSAFFAIAPRAARVS